MTRVARAALRLALVAGVVGAISCDELFGPKGPKSGALAVSLTSPNLDDGAILFSVSGGTVDSVTIPPGSGLQVMASQSTPRTALVRGTLTSGVIAQIWVRDISATYSATVQQVAAKTYAQRSQAGYSLAIATP